MMATPAQLLIANPLWDVCLLRLIAMTAMRVQAMPVLQTQVALIQT